MTLVGWEDSVRVTFCENFAARIHGFVSCLLVRERASQSSGGTIILDASEMLASRKEEQKEGGREGGVGWGWGLFLIKRD